MDVGSVNTFKVMSTVPAPEICSKSTVTCGTTSLPKIRKKGQHDNPDSNPLPSVPCTRALAIPI